MTYLRDVGYNHAVRNSIPDRGISRDQEIEWIDKRIKSQNRSGSQIPVLGNNLRSGDVLDQIRTEPGPFLDLIGNFIHGGSAGCKSTDLLQSGIIHGEVLVQVLSVAPNIAFQELNALHVQEYLDGIRHGLAV